jgi:hypothetical protein
MTTVLAGACVSQCFAGCRAQTERVIEFAIGEQAGIGCYNGAAKLNRNPAIKIDTENLALRFTHQVRHVRTARSCKTCCYYSEISTMLQ